MCRGAGATCRALAPRALRRVRLLAPGPLGALTIGASLRHRAPAQAARRALGRLRAAAASPASRAMRRARCASRSAPSASKCGARGSTRRRSASPRARRHAKRHAAMHAAGRARERGTPRFGAPFAHFPRVVSRCAPRAARTSRFSSRSPVGALTIAGRSSLEPGTGARGLLAGSVPCCSPRRSAP